MIVRILPAAIQLITQPDHARLAGEIMARSSGLRNHPRRASILHAVAEHDNGWREEDEAPAVDGGEVVDFVRAPLAVRHRVWPRGVARLKDDPWAAALVAQHAITVYDRFRTDTAWDSFFAAMEAARDRMRRAAAGALEDLRRDYVWVRLGDLVSLAFCTGWTDEHRFGAWTVQLEGDRVRITPDPFDGETIPVHVDARELPNRPFDSDDQLREEIRRAPVVTLTGVVQTAR
jgi:hypothetical protein